MQSRNRGRSRDDAASSVAGAAAATASPAGRRAPIGSGRFGAVGLAKELTVFHEGDVHQAGVGRVKDGAVLAKLGPAKETEM